MRRLTYFQSLVLALFLLFFVSCQNQLDVPTAVPATSPKISVEQANDWVRTSLPTRSLQSQGDILWDMAEETTFNGAY